MTRSSSSCANQRQSSTARRKTGGRVRSNSPAAAIMVLASFGRAVFLRRTMALFAFISIRPPRSLSRPSRLPMPRALSRRRPVRSSAGTSDDLPRTDAFSIIDDERPILMTLEALLGRHGYQLEVAANAATGMRLLAEQTARPRPARPATARRRWPADARTNQGRASGHAGDHSDRARFA